MLAMMGVLLLTMTLLSARLSTGSISLDRAWIPMFVVVKVMAYQALAAWWITRCLSRGVQPPQWFWVASVLVDCTIPTIGIVVGWRVELVDLQRVTTAPVAFLYGVFIVLSILRLRPWLTIISGVVCFGQYLLASHWIASVEGLVIPDGLIWIYPTMVLITGLAASFVSHRLRQSVLRGLEEAVERERAEGEMGAAAKIQLGLLPTRSPDVTGYDVAGWNAPAERTGGDFYGWLTLPDGRTIVVLADVSGHGLGAAMVAVLCRAYARACLETAADEQEAATRLNRLLSTDVPPGMFATLVMVALIPGSDRVEVLSAGHGPIYLMRRGGEIESLEAAGLPLGVDETAEFAKGTVTTMGEGDTLVLVSDGVFERRREDGAMFGTGRLIEVARSMAADAESLVRAIREAADGFAAGEPAQDDVTIVAIRRRE